MLGRFLILWNSKCIFVDAVNDNKLKNMFFWQKRTNFDKGFNILKPLFIRNQQRGSENELVSIFIYCNI